MEHQNSNWTNNLNSMSIYYSTIFNLIIKKAVHEVGQLLSRVFQYSMHTERPCTSANKTDLYIYEM